MKLHILATALTMASALSFATPAAAVTVPIDYSLSTVNPMTGINEIFGTMILDYDGSTYSFESILLPLDKKTPIITSGAAFSPVPGTSDYCLYKLPSCSVVTGENSFYLIFDPSLTSQTATIYGYSVDKASLEQVPITIERAAVPEPATWALMLAGFGALGVSMRWRRRRTVPLALRWSWKPGVSG